MKVCSDNVSLEEVSKYIAVSIFGPAPTVKAVFLIFFGLTFCHLSLSLHDGTIILDAIRGLLFLLTHCLARRAVKSCWTFPDFSRAM